MAFIDSGKGADKESQYQKMKKRMENLEQSKITIRIPTHIAKKFKRKLCEDETNANQFLLGMILKYIEK